MTPITNSVPNDVIATYLYANTPSYLYRHFRTIPYVKALADSFALEDIVGQLSSLTSQDVQSPKEGALAYALLISLTFFDYDTASRALMQIDPSLLDWGEEIRDIFLKTAKSTKIEHITPTFPPLQQSIRLLSQSTSNTSATYTISKRSGEGPKSD
jgi:hypothetical protein